MMSGLDSNNLAHSFGSEPMSESNTSSDAPATENPAASLRAAALLTLKSKRRKAPTTAEALSHVPSPRPIPAPDSIQLDYGTEESAPITPTAPAAKTASTSTLQSLSDKMDIDEQSKEEGEISDSEQPPPKPVLTSGSLSPNVPTKSTTKEEHSVSAATEIPKLTSAAIKKDSLSTSLHGFSISSIGSPTPLSAVPERPSRSASFGGYIIDEAHARPGLTMSQAQYDTAKDIVLDLLGWGVPPEYLVDCGLSREIVYYVFVELNLRLPANLDISGLPVPNIDILHGSPEPMTPPPHGTYTQRGLISSGSFSQKSALPQGPRTSALSAAAPPFVPGVEVSQEASAADSSQSLLDMELQRRQELLARKAVLASRKSKRAGTKSEPSVQSLLPVTGVASSTTPTSPIPTETVEDFLKTIEPVDHTEKRANKRPRIRQPSANLDDMDVDEPIPGLTALGPVPGVDSPPRSSVSLPRSPVSALVTPMSVMLPPPSVTDESSSSSRGVSRERSSGLGETQENKGSWSSRRVTKRPVAADFVDIEPGPSRPPSHGHGHHSHHPHAPKRKQNSFAGLHGGSRRMIIDLSDSEEEVEDQVGGRDVHRGVSQARHMPRSATATSFSAAPTTPVPPGTPQNALLEKELEIKRMKELIAQRERARLDKIVVHSKRNTPVHGAPDAIIKQEDDEPMPPSSLTSTPVPGLTETSQEPNSAPSSTRSSSAAISDLATPADVIPETLEHPTAGDHVLTDEARQERIPVASSPISQKSRSSTPSVTHIPSQVTREVDDASPRQEAPSTQTNTSDPDEQEPNGQPSSYVAYTSFLSTYPLLYSHSLACSSGVDHLHVGSSSTDQRTPSTPGSSALSLDLGPLRSIAVNKHLTDPLKRICQYEVPGGGECRDRDCEDIHLSRLEAIEPSDEDMAEYLSHVLSHRSQLSARQLQVALEDMRRRKPGLHLVDVVTETLTSLGLNMRVDTSSS